MAPSWQAAQRLKAARRIGLHREMRPFSVRNEETPTTENTLEKDQITKLGYVRVDALKKPVPETGFATNISPGTTKIRARVGQGSG